VEAKLASRQQLLEAKQEAKLAAAQAEVQAEAKVIASMWTPGPDAF
jgi:hypothetical protein